MDTLRYAIERIRSGDRAGGKRLLVEILRAEPRNEVAWLWLAATVDEVEQQRECLVRVLRINSTNQTALRILRTIPDGVSTMTPIPPSALPAASPSRPAPR
jgi:hypothetical protein